MNKLTVPRHFMALGQVTLCQILLAFGLYFYLNEASAQVGFSTSYTAFKQAEKTEGVEADKRVLTGDLAYSFAAIHKVKLYVEAEEYSDPRSKSQVVDLFAQYGIKAWQDARKWNTLMLSARIGAPSNDFNTLRTLENYFRLNVTTLSTLNTISPDLSLTLRANFRRNNFKNTSFISGKDDAGNNIVTNNVKSSSGQGFDLSYTLLKKISLELSFTHINLFKFEGPSVEVYTHSQTIGYAISDKFKISLAHTLAPDATSAFNPDGTDYGFRGFEGQNSYFSAGLSLSI